MLFVKVAILSLLHLQQVTVNDVDITAEKLVREKLTFRGAIRIRAAGNFQRTYNGALEITARNNELQLILTTSREDLVAAIVSAESPPAAPPAARKAQAILARSWIEASKGRHGQFDLCDTTHCQHFKEATEAGTIAAKRTQGLILAWQGKVFAPAYSASCGGRTKTAAAIGWNDENKYPYFEVDCPICQRNEPDWSRNLNEEDVAQIRANPNKEQTRITIGRRSGWAALPSNNYELTDLEVRGRGQGHGLGYCQRGGAGMAKQGATPAEILRHYFPGTDIISSR
ncbi:MAG: SpoIID/LytB domain-containing protein [Bryobacteraceae bacterium]